MSQEFVARVVSLHLHPAKPGLPLKPVDFVDVVAGKGIEGEPRYFGRISQATGQPSRRQLSLIEREQITAHAASLGLETIPPGAVRANIETLGLDLIASVGQQIEIGGAVEKSEAYLGDIALKQGKFGEARVRLEKSVRSFSKSRITHYDLGILDAREKKYDRAASEFRQAIEMDPSRADGHYRLAGVLRAQGEEKLAQEELKKVSQIHEKTRETLLHEISGVPPKVPEQ